MGLTRTSRSSTRHLVAQQIAAQGKRVEVLQANLYHVAAATAVVEFCLARGQVDVALTQEPWANRSNIMGFNAAGKLIYNGTLIISLCIYCLQQKHCMYSRVVHYRPGGNTSPLGITTRPEYLYAQPSFLERKPILQTI